MINYLETEEAPVLGQSFETQVEGKRSFLEANVTLLGCRALVLKLIEDAINVYLGGLYEEQVRVNWPEHRRAEEWIFCTESGKYDMDFNCAWEQIFPNIEPWVVKTRLKRIFENRDAEMKKFRLAREEEIRKINEADEAYARRRNGQGKVSHGRRRQPKSGDLHRDQRDYAGPRDWLEQLLGG